MNRRRLLLGGSAFAFGCVATAPSAATAPKRPRPVVDEAEIAPGLTLLYYRVVPALYGDGWEIYGEYRNDTVILYDAPYLRFRFTDDAGNTYWQGEARPSDNLLPPGEVRPFQADVYHNELSLIEGWTKFTVTSCAWGEQYVVNDLAGISFELERVDLDEGNNGFLTGMVQVKNTGTTTSQRPWLNVIARDPRGRIISIDKRPIDGPIEPGKFVRSTVSASIAEPGAEYDLLLNEETIRTMSC